MMQCVGCRPAPRGEGSSGGHAWGRDGRADEWDAGRPEAAGEDGGLGCVRKGIVSRTEQNMSMAPLHLFSVISPFTPLS